MQVQVGDTKIDVPLSCVDLLNGEMCGDCVQFPCLKATLKDRFSYQIFERLLHQTLVFSEPDYDLCSAYLCVDLEESEADCFVLLTTDMYGITDEVTYSIDIDINERERILSKNHLFLHQVNACI